MLPKPKLDPDALKDFIRASGLSYKSTGVSYVFNCPKCSKKDKLYIRKSDGRFRCFYCYQNIGFFGRADYALSELTGIDRKYISTVLFGTDEAAFSLLMDVQFREDGDDREIEDEVLETQFPYDYYPIDHSYSVRGLEYLQGRGVTLDIAKQYGIRYAPTERRVVFPIESDGALLGWQGRLVIDTKYEDENGEIQQAVKAKNSPGLKRERLVMFGDRVKDDQIILCEGPVSAIKCHLCGSGNIATMGKGVSRKQIELIKNSGVKKLYLALDPDAATETGNLVKELIGDMEIYHMLPPGEDSDLGDMTYEEVRELYLKAPRVNGMQIFAYIKSHY